MRVIKSKCVCICVKCSAALLGSLALSDGGLTRRTTRPVGCCAVRGGAVRVVPHYVAVYGAVFDSVACCVWCHAVMCVVLSGAARSASLSSETRAVQSTTASEINS